MRRVRGTEMMVWDDRGGLKEKGRINKRKGKKIKGKEKKQEKGIQSAVQREKLEIAEIQGWIDEMKKELLEAIKEGYKNNQEKEQEQEQESGGDKERPELENGEEVEVE